MKVIFQCLSLGLLLTLMTACHKEEIPDPTDNENVPVSHSLFVSGTFDGTQETKTIDGVNYSAESYMISSPGPIGEWSADIYNLNGSSIGIPELSFHIVNHEQSSTFDYQDLVQSTSSSTIEFVDDMAPLETQYGRLSVFYFPNENDFYASDMALGNTPLTVLEAKDTIVDGEQYRILEVTGSINLTDVNTLNDITIDNLHARLAFGL